MSIQKIFMGIDPGKSGAVAVIDENCRPLEIYDCPVGEPEMAKVIKEIVEKYPQEEYIILGAVERVHAMPKQGVSSVFTFGKNFGNWTMALAYAEIPFLLPTPQAWQKGLMVKSNGSKKSKSFVAASRLFPTAELKGSKGGIKDGRCDALLIAYWRSLQ